MISISANPSPDYGVSSYADYEKALNRAKEEGVFIMAVSSDVDYGFRFGGLSREPLGDPNNLNAYYATDLNEWKDEGRIFFPMGSRAFSSYVGENDYSWIRSGGASWTAPYIAGLYAMALQVNPEVTPDLFWSAIEETADVKMDSVYNKNILIANPVNLISKLAGKSYTALSSSKATEFQAIILKPYDDIGQLFWPNRSGNVFEQNQYKPEDIYTYSFDNTTVFKGSEALASEILEGGKNPGLGIRKLHQQGITGKNVNVAIIDGNMLTDHPEFAGRIVSYYDSGCNEPEDEGSYHGASVTGILGGRTIGVAPEVNIYYAAAPEERDAKYFADSLNWIIEQNKALPKSEKIRVVSVSAAPTSEGNWYKNGELWEEAVLKAQKDGIMVIDCRTNEDTGFVFSLYYDLADQDNVTKCAPGYPGNYERDFKAKHWQKMIFAPASFRTCAQELIKDEYCYRYDGVGGQSWAVPYVSGVLALGWQVNPKLDGETMKNLLFQSSWVNEDGLHFINPPTFIDAVRKSH